MTLIGMELSDAGIMAAAGDPPQLLSIDGPMQESPGFAVREKGKLLVGKAAESKSRLYPRKVSNHFWDQLDTEALDQPGFHKENNAEIAYAHLSRIWEIAKGYGDEVVMAVPGYMNRNQLGLLLGIAQELSMPVSGFVNLAVAATSNPFPEGLLLCLDVHLHRTEITYLKQDSELGLEDTVTNPGKGLDFIRKKWIGAIAAEFVRTTRFDPLHKAVTEQDVYDRVPEVMRDLVRKPNVVFEINRGHQRLSTNLSHSLFAPLVQSAFDELLHSIKRIQKKYATDETPMALQLTHRLADIGGLEKLFEQIPHTQIRKLQPGAGALGILRCWNQIKGHQIIGPQASYYSSCPLLKTESDVPPKPQPKVETKRPPTHILYRDLAFPISEKPLYADLQDSGSDLAFHFEGPGPGDSAAVYSIGIQDDKIILTNYGNTPIYVDDRPVDGSIPLHQGQIVRIGSAGQEVRLITTMDLDET